jgi:hypothetical protein
MNEVVNSYASVQKVSRQNKNNEIKRNVTDGRVLQNVESGYLVYHHLRLYKMIWSLPAASVRLFETISNSYSAKLVHFI